MKIQILAMSFFLVWNSLGFSDVPVMVRSPKEKMKFYPCSSCHRPSPSIEETLLTARGKREGNPHRNLEFKHMPEVRDCFMCHGHKDSDTLVLLDGEPVSYEQVPLLCGQCHGLKKGEWERGLHGRLEGNWKTQKIKPICIECHNAHKPKFPKLKAFPPPQIPKFGKKKGESKHEMDTASP